MLAVVIFQERCIERAKLVLLTLRLLQRRLPALVPAADIAEVDKAAVTNKANPAVVALLPTALLRMAAALVGTERLERALEGAVDAAKEELTQQVPLHWLPLLLP